MPPLPLLLPPPPLSQLQELAAPVSSVALGRAGQQFFLIDRDGSPGSGPGSSGSSSPRAAVAGGNGAEEPLVYRLSQDRPEEVRGASILKDDLASCQRAQPTACLRRGG